MHTIIWMRCECMRTNGDATILTIRTISFISAQKCTRRTCINNKCWLASQCTYAWIEWGNGVWAVRSEQAVSVAHLCPPSSLPPHTPRNGDTNDFPTTRQQKHLFSRHENSHQRCPFHLHVPLVCSYFGYRCRCRCRLWHWMWIFIFCSCRWIFFPFFSVFRFPFLSLGILFFAFLLCALFPPSMSSSSQSSSSSPWIIPVFFLFRFVLLSFCTSSEP